jgi:hypothetical protein
MTEAEIREYIDEHIVKNTVPHEIVGLRLLGEIAAQLAHLNDPEEKLKAADLRETLAERALDNAEKMLQQGDAMAWLLSRDPAKEPFWDTAAKQAIALWKAARP